MSKPSNLMLPSKIANHTCKIQQKELDKLRTNKINALEFIDRYLSLNLDDFNAKSLLIKLKEILER